MKISKIKIIAWLIVLILILLTYMVFTNTFALFEDNAEGTVDNDIGKWVVKINNRIISSSTTQNITINSFVYDTVSTVQGGYIAPGSSAYFDLILDATECDVAVRYDIAFNFESMSYSDNISMTVEELGSNNIVLTDADTYSGIVDLDSILDGDTVTLRVHVTWNDISDYDESDTSLGIVKNSKLVIPISVHAEQYLGETLVPYVPAEPEEPGD